MFLTIITSSLNCSNLVDYTAHSICCFPSTDIQWIIVDGLSTDSTVDNILKHSQANIKLLVEKDTGIYDAWNKACNLIEGEWVLFLGMGDQLHSDLNLNELKDFLQGLPQTVLLCYGNVDVLHKFNFLYTSRKPSLDGWEFGRPKLPNHQGVFHRSCVLKDGNPFDTSYKIAADSKLLLNILRGTRIVHFDQVVSKFDDAGVSNRPENFLLINSEIARICDELNIKTPCFHRIVNMIRVLLIVSIFTQLRILKNFHINFKKLFQI